MKMSQTVYRYQFNKKVPLQEVEDSLMLAVLAAEGIHGRSRLQLDAKFLLDKGKKTCVIDAGNEVGIHIACIFTEFLSRQFGEQAFQVKRVDGNSHIEPNNWRRIPGLFNKREIREIKTAGKEFYQESRGKDSWGQEVFAIYQRDQGTEAKQYKMGKNNG
jgi:hypothetical protein